MKSVRETQHGTHWIRLLWIIVLCFSLSISTNNAYALVNASDYHSFWWWGGVQKQPVIDEAQRLYLLQGEVATLSPQKQLQYAIKQNRAVNELTETSEFLPQGFAIPRQFSAEVVLVYRATTLNWSSKMMPILLAQVKRWQAKGNRVVGIQIDFDVRTKALDEYINFLSHLRQQLPEKFHLSITGLMDWASHADIQSVTRLKGIVDEVIVQTYQGKHTIPNYRQYLSQLDRLNVPFKIGLVQRGEWQKPKQLEELDLFRGYVIFLVNE